MFDVTSMVRRLRAENSDSQSVEAKSAAGGVPSSIATTLSAFANMPGGGDIVLGLDERSGFAVVPIDISALKKAIASIARQAVKPPVTIEFAEADFEGERLLIIQVSEMSTSAKPCVVKRTGRAYLRSWDGDFELSEVELQGLLVNRTQPRFDTRPIDTATRDDLQPDLMADYLLTARLTDRGLARLADDELVLRKTGVVTVAGTPSVAGLLALGEYPQEWFPNYVIQAAASPEPGSPAGTRVGDIARFSGPLPQMIDDALIWVATHSRHRIVDSADGRVRDQFDFPPSAVRELLSNALVHRDLAEWSWSRAIELRITDTELRLTNPGGLYGLTVARLLTNQLTSARNLTLTRICQYIKLRDGRVVEALATGIPKILEATVGDGLPAPRFFDQAISFTAILTRPAGLATTPQVSAAPREQTTIPVVTGAERRVLDALGWKAHTLVPLASATLMSPQTLRKHLRNLRSKGLVEMDGGSGQRKTTYRQTP